MHRFPAGSKNARLLLGTLRRFPLLPKKQPPTPTPTPPHSTLLLSNGSRSRGLATLADTSASSSSLSETSCPFQQDEHLPTCAEPLGQPLPNDQHACSVSLPTWSDVVGYEEGEPDVVSRMPCGYPRFVYHPYIIQLGQCVVSKYGINTAQQQEDCLLLPSKEAAVRCRIFLQQALYPSEQRKQSKLVDVCRIVQGSNLQLGDDEQNGKIRMVDLQSSHNVHAVLFPAETLAGMEAKAYWQHTGELVSSRCAEAVLKESFDQEPKPLSPHCRHGVSSTAITEPSHIQQERNPHGLLQDRIASLTHVPSDHVFLTPSGMASLYMSLLASRRVIGEDAASVVFGFPYLDTLKLCSRAELCPGGVEFYGHGHEKDLKALERQLQTNRKFCSLMTEVPSNPLLQCPDLHKLRRLADEYNFCLVVDDTIGNFGNLNLLESGLADCLSSSLTKLVSGRGDAMAGSVVCNPHTEKGRLLQQDLLKHQPKSDLHPSDALAVYQNSENFLERNAQINETAEQLADFLSQHPDVDRVYYPKYTPLYEQFTSQPHSYGGLLSILLDRHICQRTFFDALQVAKGPSLGTNFTLACPYTLLAHYHELDFAMEYNVQPNLLRISVGLESLEVLKDKFSQALATSRLHPKIPHPRAAAATQRRSFSTAVAVATRLHRVRVGWL